MGCITLTLIISAILILFLPGGSEIVFSKEFLILFGIFWFTCFIIWLLFGDLIDTIAGVDHYEE
jgi:hypothetical protein